VETLVGAAIFGVLMGASSLWDSLPAGWFSRSVPTATGETEVRAQFGFCHTGGGTNCVVDGDTIWLQGQNIRVADIDAPETHEYGCEEEKALGDRATARLQELLNGGAITLGSIDRDEDKYGRQLRLVQVNGTSVGDTLVNEGLARSYEGHRRPWC
jgi:endonuclease YncB( thermonuclease family)